MNDDYFGYWLSNIAGSSELIADTDALRKVWIHSATDITSAYDVNELLEQLLGDLHLEEEIDRFEDKLRKIGALEQITAFANELIALEKKIKDDPQLELPETLLASQAWQDLQAIAIRITQLPSVRNFTP